MRLPSPVFKCPSCGAVMPNAQYKAGRPWTCPACSGRFRTSRRYENVAGWGSTVLTLAFFYALGLRGLRLLLATAVMWFPAQVISVFVLDRLIPPRLVPYERGGSFGSGMFPR